MGWQDFQILRGGILNIGGVRVGFAPGLHFFRITPDPASLLSVIIIIVIVKWFCAMWVFRVSILVMFAEAD